MIQNIIHRLLLRRHFWRYATFGEIAEIYASRTMRILAQQMIGIFIAIYLYQTGYKLDFIALFFASMFAARIFIAYPAARFIAHFGPKHGSLAGNLLYIPALICFTLVPHYGTPALVVFAIFQSLSMVVYDLSYMVNFSKVKHADHAGKEIGYMLILERVTASVSPFIGGALAYFIAPEATMWFSALFFAVASVPLFRTKEPVRLGQKLSFRKFPIREARRSIMAETAVGFDNFSSLSIWALFLAVVVFGASTNQVYLIIGGLASVTIATSLLAAYWFGRVIDRKRGGDLLTIATAGNALTHIFRAFITGPSGAVAANISNDIATTGYSMTFLRGIFDTADRLEGYRIAYLCCISMALNVGAALCALIFFALLHITSDTELAFRLFFVIAGSYVLLTLTARFRLYR